MTSPESSDRSTVNPSCSSFRQAASRRWWCSGLLLFTTITTWHSRPFRSGLCATTSSAFPMISLDEYVIMPNHFHGIVVINEWDRSRERDVGKRLGAMERVGAGKRGGAGDRVGARPTPTEALRRGIFFRAICPNLAFFYHSYDNVVPVMET